jgi:hypothetical protein
MIRNTPKQDELAQGDAIGGRPDDPYNVDRFSLVRASGNPQTRDSRVAAPKSVGHVPRAAVSNCKMACRDRLHRSRSQASAANRVRFQREPNFHLGMNRSAERA